MNTTMLGSDLAAALDAVAFARQLGIEPDDWQRDTLRSTAPRQLLNCSRQAGKSTVAAVLALHRAIYRPQALCLLLSPTLRQSTELFRRATTLLAQLPQAPRPIEDTKTSLTLDNGARIISLPGSEGSVRGYSAVDLLVIDEASQVPDELYYAVRPFLAVSGGTLVVMSTPRGRSGFFADTWHDGTGWERTEIPATSVTRISPAFLAEEREALGSYWFEQEYLCMFKTDEASVFDFDDVRRALDPRVTLLFPAGVA